MGNFVNSKANETTVSLNKPEWDYTKQASSYYKRPNYAPLAIDHLCKYVGANTKNFITADIGAGTANLTKLISNKVAKVYSVEPNFAMRTIGIESTKTLSNVEWIVGTGEQNNLKDQSVHLAAFGSSFNTVDRLATLKECHRILKDDGYFTCMWNNRDLTIPTQTKTEEIIQRYYPAYSHGVRREQQADVILESKLFNHVYYFETPQIVKMPVNDFCEAWRSVKNNFWDLSTKEGAKNLEAILTDIRQEFKNNDPLELVYVTKIWIAKKQK